MRAGERSAEAGECECGGRATVLEVDTDDVVRACVRNVEVPEAIECESGRLKKGDAGSRDRDRRTARRDFVDGGGVGRRDVERAVAGDDDGGERSSGGRGRNGCEDSCDVGGGGLEDAAIEGVVDVEVAGAVVDSGGGIDGCGRDAGERGGRSGGRRGDHHLRPEAGSAKGNVVGHVPAAVLDEELAEAKAEDGRRKGDGDVARGWAGDGTNAGLARDGEVLVGRAFGEGRDGAHGDDVAGRNREDEGGDSRSGGDGDSAEVDGTAGGEGLGGGCGGEPCQRKEDEQQRTPRRAGALIVEGASSARCVHSDPPPCGSRASVARCDSRARGCPGGARTWKVLLQKTLGKLAAPRMMLCFGALWGEEVCPRWLI